MKGVGRAAACMVAIAVSVHSSGAQQPSPPRPGAAQPNVIISGRVVSADADGLPLRGARVAVVGGPTVAPVFTDGGGRFSVAVPSDYALAISKTGFAPAVVTGRASTPSAELTIRLALGAAIEGQVVDGGGFPVSNARVRVRRVDSAGGGSEITADTDDAGAYRIGSLPAGRYQLHSERATVDSISAQPFVDSQPHDIQQMREQQLRQRTNAPPMSEIVTVDLRAGEQSAVTLFHQTHAVLPPDAPIGGFVSGVVTDEFGDPLAGVDVRLLLLRYSRERYVAYATGVSRRTDDRGRFRLFYVTPGRYVLAATSDDPRVAPVYYPDVTEVSGALPLIIGRKQEVSGIGIQFRRVVLASSAGDLSGRVLDARGAAADDYRVVVFSTNRDRWFAGSQFVRIAAGPDVDDGFRVTSLPPDDYFAAAVDGIEGDADSGEWQNPEVLAALSTRAQRVRVGERQRAAADLRLIRWTR